MSCIPGRSSRRRPYLLLEVLIALTLVALCVVPLLRPHLHMIGEERRFIRDVELDRAANLVIADIMEQLYRNEIPWSQVAASEAAAVSDALVAKLGYRCQYRLTIQRSKPKDPVYHLLKLALDFSPVRKGDDLHYEQLVFVERHPLTPEIEGGT